MRVTALDRNDGPAELATFDENEGDARIVSLMQNLRLRLPDRTDLPAVA